jgi:hypothetical protein
MNWYRVIVSFEVEAANEEEAAREANSICNGVVESVSFVEQIDPATIACPKE